MTQTEQKNVNAALRALKVLTLTPGTVTFLLENDPQALQQALLAVRPFTDDPSQIEALDAALLEVNRILRVGEVPLTDLERRVLRILREQAEDCSGGDFGIIEEVKVPGITRQALGGVLTSLQAKDILHVWEPTFVNGTTKVTQFTFNDREPISASL